MTNIYISNARKAAQLSLKGRRELIGFGVSKTRLGICSVYKWQEITLFVLQHNPNFKKKLFICGLPIISWKRPVIEEPIEGRYVLERNREPRVYINVGSLPFYDNRSGIPRVAKELAAHGLHWREKVVVPIYADPLKGQYRYAAHWALDKGCDISQLKALHAFCDNGSDAPVTFASGDWLVHTMINPNEIAFEADQFTQMRELGVKVGFVLHDLIAERSPDYFKHRDARNFARWLRVLGQYDGIFAVSRSTLNDYLSWCQENAVSTFPQQIQGWFHLGADFVAHRSELTASDNEVLNQLRNHSFYLQVSTIEPRKGFAQLLSAFELLWKDNSQLTLVLVGRQGWLVRGLCRRISRHLENKKRLFWFSGLSDTALNALYEQARCVVVASEAEGYGLSVVEGANHQKPLLVRDIPAFREVAPKGVHFFSGLEPQELAAAIERMEKAISEHRIQPYALCPQSWAQSVHAFVDLLQSGE